MKPEDLTAWALNQLSPEEQAQLEARLQQNPDEQKLAAATKDFCTFLTSELRDESLALSDEQRAQFLTPRSASFQSSQTSIKPSPLRWWQRPAIPLALAASLALLGALSVLYMPMLSEKAGGLSDLVAFGDKEKEEVRFQIANADSSSSKSQIAAIPKDIGGTPTPLVREPQAEGKVIALAGSDVKHHEVAAAKRNLTGITNTSVGTTLPQKTSLDQPTLPGAAGMPNQILGNFTATQSAPLSAPASNSIAIGPGSLMKNREIGRAHV